MVAFFFLFAPIVVLVAVLLMQQFQPSRDPAKPEPTGPGRVEPQFATAPAPEKTAASDPDAADAQADPRQASVITVER